VSHGAVDDGHALWQPARLDQGGNKVKSQGKHIGVASCWPDWAALLPLRTSSRPRPNTPASRALHQPVPAAARRDTRPRPVLRQDVGTTGQQWWSGKNKGGSGGKSAWMRWPSRRRTDNAGLAGIRATPSRPRSTPGCVKPRTDSHSFRPLQLAKMLVGQTSTAAKR